MHELEQAADGTWSFAYREGSDVPWHRYGQQIPADAPKSDWIRGCNGEYDLAAAPLFYEVEGKRYPLKDRNALYCTDDPARHMPNAASDQCHIHQPSAIFGAFFDAAGEAELPIDAMGHCSGRSIFWALARLSEDDYIVPSKLRSKPDAVTPYLLMQSGADLATATRFNPTRVRRVCANTIRFGAAEDDRLGLTQRVTHQAPLNLEELKGKLGIVQWKEQWKRHCETLDMLTAYLIDPAQAAAFFTELLRKETEAEIAVRKAKDLSAQDASVRAILDGKNRTPEDRKAPRGSKRLLELYTGTVGQPGATTGDLFSAVEAVTYYVDKDRGKDEDKRQASAWFGQGSLLKQRAERLAVAVATEGAAA